LAPLEGLPMRSAAQSGRLRTSDCCQPHRARWLALAGRTEAERRSPAECARRAEIPSLALRPDTDAAGPGPGAVHASRASAPAGPARSRSCRNSPRRR